MQGLQNLGNTCYINSIVQCLGHVSAFRMAVLENGSDAPLQMLLRRRLSELMMRMWTLSTKRATIVPNHLLSELQKNPQFAGFRQQDAHDLYLRIMDDAGSSAVHLTKVEAATQVRCTSCKFSGNERVESDPSVSLSLLESVEFPSKVAAGSASRLSLSSLVQHHWQQTEALGDYKCERCQKVGACIKSCTMKVAPAVLVLHIKRFAWVPRRGASPTHRYSPNVCHGAVVANLLHSGCVKVPDLFDFPIDNMKFGGKTYFLRGMVIHHGARLESGHYTACCRCSLPGAGDNKWYMFDDSRVSPVSEVELQHMQPYILFYCESSLRK
jgi:ubiquitin carboxyl-terminal hydrolase 36/42